MHLNQKNDVPGFNSGLGMARSWYAATAAPSPQDLVFEGEAGCDLVVVGAGCTGLAVALFAARSGRRVIVLEGGEVGWGASGRNGGQIIPGLRKGADELVGLLGVERARVVFDLAIEARHLVAGLVDELGIDCDLRLTGHLLGAVKPGDLKAFEAEAECLDRVMHYPHVRLLDRAAVQSAVASPEFEGGMLDGLGGHLHPLNYTLGLARACRDAGVTIHRRSPAIALERGAGVVLSTPRGRIRASHAVLAGDALLSGLSTRVNSRMMPIASYIVATEPLSDPSALIAGDIAVSDSRFVVDYFRMTRDGRLLFGGGERYSPEPPGDIGAFVRPYVERAFPQLAGVRFDHAWGGLVSVTMSRLPHIGRQGPVLFAHGYSGQGVILSSMAGRLLAAALDGDAAGLETFAALEPPPFPGGALLRWPLHVLGMVWYALRDRL
jgi:gamma-glutamylputrescine oxidase